MDGPEKDTAARLSSPGVLIGKSPTDSCVPSEQPQRLGLRLLFRLTFVPQWLRPVLAACCGACRLPGRVRGPLVGRVHLGSSSQMALALATTAGNWSASPKRSRSSKDSMWGSAEGCCTPMVARPPLMVRTTFSSCEVSVSARSGLLTGIVVGNVGFLACLGIAVRLPGRFPRRPASSVAPPAGTSPSTSVRSVVRRFLGHAAEEELLGAHHVRCDWLFRFRLASDHGFSFP